MPTMEREFTGPAEAVTPDRAPIPLVAAVLRIAYCPNVMPTVLSFYRECSVSPGRLSPRSPGSSFRRDAPPPPPPPSTVRGLPNSVPLLMRDAHGRLVLAGGRASPDILYT